MGGDIYTSLKVISETYNNEMYELTWNLIQAINKNVYCKKQLILIFSSQTPQLVVPIKEIISLIFNFNTPLKYTG